MVTDLLLFQYVQGRAGKKLNVKAYGHWLPTLPQVFSAKANERSRDMRVLFIQWVCLCSKYLLGVVPFLSLYDYPLSVISE